MSETDNTQPRKGALSCDYGEQQAKGLTPLDNRLVEEMARRSMAKDGLSFDHLPEIARQAAISYQKTELDFICTHSGLTVEILEMIRRGEAVVAPTQNLWTLDYFGDDRENREIETHAPSNIQLNTPIERREG